MFTHLPIGLILGAFLFTLISWLSRREALHRTAGRCLLMALIMLVPTALMGYLDWHHFLGGNPVYAIKVKAVLAGVLALLMIITLMTVSKRRAAKFHHLMLYLTCAICVMVIAFYGGQIVHGPRAPQSPAQELSIDQSGSAAAPPKVLTAIPAKIDLD